MDNIPAYVPKEWLTAVKIVDAYGNITWMKREPNDKIDWLACGGVPTEVTMARLDNLRYALHPTLRMQPSKIMVNNVTTICVFPDGTKITARPDSVDEFDLDVGIAMCIVKYIYGSRQAFKRAAKSAHVQE